MIEVIAVMHGGDCGGIANQTQKGHKATRRMAKCCVLNGMGEPQSLAKLMRVLNKARITIKKKTLCRRDRSTRSVVCIGTKNCNI
jgi:intergrase/recombinase